MLMKCINSGSSGNGYALISDDEVLLIECGVPSKEMLRAIDALSLMSMVKETMQSISSST